MHKLRNRQHQELLERIMKIVPPGYKEPIFMNMKHKIRQFCSAFNWNEDDIRKRIGDDTWFYHPIFFKD
jgi:hypothetical protein